MGPPGSIACRPATPAPARPPTARPDRQSPRSARCSRGDEVRPDDLGDTGDGRARPQDCRDPGAQRALVHEPALEVSERIVADPRGSGRGVEQDVGRGVGARPGVCRRLTLEHAGSHAHQTSVAQRALQGVRSNASLRSARALMTRAGCATPGRRLPSDCRRCHAPFPGLEHFSPVAPPTARGSASLSVASARSGGRRLPSAAASRWPRRANRASADAPPRVLSAPGDTIPARAAAQLGGALAHAAGLRAASSVPTETSRRSISARCSTRRPC